MAAARRKKKNTVVKIELGWGGLLSLGVVIFCIFLWMFLLGLWVGQGILAPRPEVIAMGRGPLPGLDFEVAARPGSSIEPGQPSGWPGTSIYAGDQT